MCADSPVLPSWSDVPFFWHSCLWASKPLFPAFLTTFRASFYASVVRRFSKVADCCSFGRVAITTVGDCLQQCWIGRIERARVSVECRIPVVKVFARCVRFWLADFHVLWAQFRHWLSHCSHGFRESRQRCVHRSVRRLLTNFNHLCSVCCALWTIRVVFTISDELWCDLLCNNITKVQQGRYTGSRWKWSWIPS